MKRILIIDESEVIRETLALILGREFIVSKRSIGNRHFLADANETIDLLILGVPHPSAAETANLVRLAAQLPFAVLFLVDSQSTARALDEKGEIGCLAKPFNPYQLQARVGQLLARHQTLPRAHAVGPTANFGRYSQYLEYPYLSRSAAALAQKFAQSRLPILISGETGCGQDRIIRAVRALRDDRGLCLPIDPAETNADYWAQKGHQLSQSRLLNDAAPTLLIENLEKCHPGAQAIVLSFLQEQEERLGPLRYLTTAAGDVLERLYRDEFLDALYHKLATLTLKLPPLRERVVDIPQLADWFARSHAAESGAVDATFSPHAVDRLRNYFWFGNLNEMETVIARTLVIHGGGIIDADDLAFDFGGGLAAAKPFSKDFSVAPASSTLAQPKLEVYNIPAAAKGADNGRSQSVDLSVVIHELAHELKNPMVTIKTFAQLLGDRYDDESFRARFQEIVGGDIERMDDLLEVMIEFADFAQPRRSKVALGEKLRSVARELQNQSIKRQTRFEWKGNGTGDHVHTDESQLTYILRNVLFAVLSQAKFGSGVDIDFQNQGSITIAYRREEARVASIHHYLKDTGAQPNDGILPLRILLAKHLVERNGGRFAMDQSDPEIDILRLEFPIG
jgi:DNA-binding NtrC family response regulator